jgi:hypothetical protein
MTKSELDGLINSLQSGGPVVDDFDGDYLQVTHKRIMSTLQYLLSDIGLGQRFIQMKTGEKEHRVSAERIKLLASRAKKIYRARDDLTDIFTLIIKFEIDAPTIRNRLLNKKLNESVEQNMRGSFDPVIEQTRLQQEASGIKSLVVQMVHSIRNLLTTYKFFNNSFVFNDRDYLKFVASEMQELKSLFSQHTVV